MTSAGTSTSLMYRINGMTTHKHTRTWRIASYPPLFQRGPRLLAIDASVTRAMVVSVSQIATYDQAKASLAPHLKGFLQHLVAGVISALTFTTASMPFDTVKTRMQQVNPALEVLAAVACNAKRARRGCSQTLAVGLNILALPIFYNHCMYAPMHSLPC